MPHNLARSRLLKKSEQKWSRIKEVRSTVTNKCESSPITSTERLLQLLLHHLTKAPIDDTKPRTKRFQRPVRSNISMKVNDINWSFSSSLNACVKIRSDNTRTRKLKLSILEVVPIWSSIRQITQNVFKRTKSMGIRQNVKYGLKTWPILSIWRFKIRI